MGSYFSSFFKVSGLSLNPQFVRNIGSIRLKSAVPVTKDKLSSLDKWPDEGQYELMFAKKNGLPLPGFPIFHSAIALANKVDQTFAIYGRQSPFDESMWSKNGFMIHTKKDNELKYLHDRYTFTVFPTGVCFKKNEIDNFLNAGDVLINTKQSCNMVNSNCYSYSVIAMTYALQCLVDRPFLDCMEIRQILSVLKEHPLNDHGSFGVYNNSVVVRHLHSVLDAIQSKIKHVYPEAKGDAGELLKEISVLKEILEKEADEYRVKSWVSGFVFGKKG